MGNSKNHKKGKIVIKDKKKFGIMLCALLIVIILIIIMISSNKVEIGDTTDLSKLDAKKYSNELVEKYNSSKDKFLEDYNKIQGGVGLYIINNSTLDENSFETMYNTITNMFNSDDWSNIEVEKNTYWNGIWSIDNSGTLKFKFSNKDLEPSWINDEDIQGKLILN